MTLQELRGQDCSHQGRITKMFCPLRRPRSRSPPSPLWRLGSTPRKPSWHRPRSGDEQQQRLQDRLSTETLTEQVPRQHTRESALESEAEVRERGALVLTREFVGDMLNSRERPWDDEYRSRPPDGG